MPRSVTKRTATASRAEGYRVETESAGTTYMYILAQEDADTLRVVEHYADPADGPRETREPKVTDAVAEEMAERGFDVVA